ncbi:MAG TPA: YggS family pyridoxal phosphate-dependent enzyme [Candidatus Limnocylindria bacterium]|nr:YggS family pyridoxal phosphate-dependent enzyme [Candidatus Limnocylindria bacterium]
MQIISEPPITADLIRARLHALRARLRIAAERAGRDPGGFRIVAVTKEWPPDVCRTALRAGLTLLGENRVQEAELKAAAVPGAEWHLVGHLQSNKARRAVRLFEVIHSVDSADLLERLDGVAADEGQAPRLLLQVNLTGEASKAGMEPAALRRGGAERHRLVTAVRRLSAARLVGLMTIARLGAAGEEARATFRDLRHLRDDLQQTSGAALAELSMGMTADAEEAVAEGATLVRIGTALFGPRPRHRAG